MDMNMTSRWCREGTMVGIVRVACEMYSSLCKITDTYMVQLVRIESQEEPEIHVIDPDTWKLTDEVLRPAYGDLFLMPEIQVRGIHVAMDYPWPGYLEKYGVDRCAIIYDILPIEMPECFEARTAQLMPEYVLGVFQHYNQIICMSKAVLNSLSAFKEKGELRPFRMDLAMTENDAFYAYMSSGWHMQDQLANSDKEARIGFYTGMISPLMLQFFLMDVSGIFRVVVNGYEIGMISAGGRRTENILIPAEIINPDGYQDILLVSDTSEHSSILLAGLSIFSTESENSPVRNHIKKPIRLGYVHGGVNAGKTSASGKTDETFRRFFHREHNEKIFLMVGTIEPRKGYDLVLDTFDRIWNQESEDKLCIIGKPGWNMEEFIVRLRNHPEAGKRLLLLDHASDGVLLEAYQKTDALIQASAGEGFGLPLIEAGQYGKPVLCSDIPVFHEVGRENVLYFPRNPEGLLQVIQFFKENCNTGKIPDSRMIAKRSWHDFTGDCYRLMTGQSPWAMCLEPGCAEEPKRKKVVVALTYTVYPPLNGGHARVIGLYKNLARDYHVELICMAPHSSKRTKNLIAPHLIQNVIPMSEETESAGLQFESKSGVTSGDMSVLLFGEKTPEYAEAIKSAGQDADWMIACHPYSYPFIKAILPNKKLIYEAQDVEYLIKKEMYHKNSTVDSALQKLFETEKECCQNSLLIMTCSEADRLKLAELYDLDPSRIIVVPNGVDTDEIEYVSVPDRLANKAKNGLSSETLGIFMGGYHEPNLEAANAIIQMADRIRKAKIFLLGSQCQYFMNRQLPDNVALMGFLSDEQKRRVFSLVDFALNPMMSGSGTNLKMFDYMAAGIPVITTEFGSRGIDNKALFITAENSSLPETINTFDLHSCSEMVSAAREHMETFFDWAKIAEGLMKKMREKE